MIAGLDQGGLGLPDRDYYLDSDDDNRRRCATAYVELRRRAMLVEAGHKPDAAKTEAADVIALETEIAKV